MRVRMTLLNVSYLNDNKFQIPDFSDQTIEQ